MANSTAMVSQALGKDPFGEGSSCFLSGTFCPVLQVPGFHVLPLGFARSPTHLVALPELPES